LEVAAMEATVIGSGGDPRREAAGAGVRMPGVLRAGLLILGLPQLAIGLWALISPRGWFDSFPGAGEHWLGAYGAYNAHLATDVGAGFVAIGVVMILAAVWLERRAVQVALVGYLAYDLPHFIYHLGADHRLDAGSHVVNDVVLGLSVVLALTLLTLTRGGARDRPSPAAAGTGSRLGAPPGGPLRWCARAYARRRYGGDLRPADAFAHTPMIATGYGALELALERSRRVPKRLKMLGQLKAAAVVGCEWCMDFGSHLARAEAGLSDRELDELARYRQSGAFSELDVLVLDYAAAISRTPAEVDDELAARLRAALDDAQIVELTAAIALENLRARFNQAVGIEPQGFSEGAACALPEPAAAAGAVAG
jgi:AhpD family alkylhydroperoxidase